MRTKSDLDAQLKIATALLAGALANRGTNLRYAHEQVPIAWRAAGALLEQRRKASGEEAADPERRRFEAIEDVAANAVILWASTQGRAPAFADAMNELRRILEAWKKPT